LLVVIATAGCAPVACSGVVEDVSVDVVVVVVVFVAGGFDPHAADSRMAARRFFFMARGVPTLDELA
jgi:hypothetical protein